MINQDEPNYEHGHGKGHVENQSSSSSNHHHHHHHQKQSENPSSKQRRRRRRKQKNVFPIPGKGNQYFSSYYTSSYNDDGGGGGGGDGDDNYYDDENDIRRTKGNIKSDYTINRFLAKVFLSFALVWSFFTFAAVNNGMPNIVDDAKSNLILKGRYRGGDISNDGVSNGGSNSAIDHVNGDVNQNTDLAANHPNDSSDSNSKTDQQNNKMITEKKSQKPPIIPSSFTKVSKAKAAFILVATEFLEDPFKSMSDAIESILRNTDRDRILCIVPIFPNSTLVELGTNPKEVREYFEDELDATLLSMMNSKSGRGSNNNNRNVRRGGSENVNGKEDGQKLIKLIIENDVNKDMDNTTETAEIRQHSERISVAKSRRKAAQFIQTLHEQQQQKDEVILTLLRPDSQIHKHDWLDIVSDALLGGPPVLPSDFSSNESFHHLNAVSFALSQERKQQQHKADRKNKQHPHYRHHYNQHYLFKHLHDSSGSSKHSTTSLDINLTPIHTTIPLKSDFDLTNGRSYPTPILEGSATSLLLSTFMELNSNLNIPDSNRFITSTVAADIELSLTLWLCGSGIDILHELHVEKDVLLMQKERDYISDKEKVWFIREWMSNGDIELKGKEDGGLLMVKNHTSLSLGQKLLLRFNHTKILNDLISEQRQETKGEDTTSHQRKKLEKCRGFDWYTKEVNIFMSKQLQVLDNHLLEEEKRKSKQMKTTNGQITGSNDKEAKNKG